MNRFPNYGSFAKPKNKHTKMILAGMMERISKEKESERGGGIKHVMNDKPCDGRRQR